MGITEVSVMEALLIALSGLLVVFAMLGILSVVIMIISTVIPTETTVKDAAVKTDADETAERSEAVNAEPVPYGGTVKLLGVDEKTAACVMAIVSHETKIPLDQLVFKSIKVLNE